MLKAIYSVTALRMRKCNTQASFFFCTICIEVAAVRQRARYGQLTRPSASGQLHFRMALKGGCGYLIFSFTFLVKHFKPLFQIYYLSISSVLSFRKFNDISFKKKKK